MGNTKARANELTAPELEKTDSTGAKLSRRSSSTTAAGLDIIIKDNL